VKLKVIRKRNYIKTDRSARAARWKRLFIGACILLSAYFLASFILGEMGLIKYYRMKEQYNSLTAEIARLKRDNANLRTNVHSLKNDPAYIERIARDKLGLARPGEIVYYYGDP